MREGITVGYGGVHQAFQLALAAEEMGCLDAFLCSFYSEGCRWGKLFDLLTRGRLRSRRVEGLGGAEIVEFPWPYLRKLWDDYLDPKLRGEWLGASDAFDRWMAGRFSGNPSAVFVGSETCDLHTLRAAKNAGAVTLHDCPQVHPAALKEWMMRAADACGLTYHHGMSGERSAMDMRKLQEYEIADWLLVYSDFHRETFVSAGHDGGRIFQCPLWVDTDFWSVEGTRTEVAEDGRLRVLFAGSIDLRKGIPFLLRAYDVCEKAISLTLVGPHDEELRPLLHRYEGRVRFTGRVSKPELKRLYQSHDVFVLPSVVDSFGFVALEAMSCGLPAIATHNCGVPVLDDWRVPAMDADALAAALLRLADDRELLAEQKAMSRGHAQLFTPMRYREKIRDLYRAVMDGC